MNNMKKALAAFVALCLALSCALGALAEEKPDVIGDLLNYYLGLEPGAAEEKPKENTEAYALPEDYVEGEEEYVFDEEEEEEIVVEEHVQVTDLAITQGLSDDWMNILLLGTDARGSTKYLRTDTMIILSINKKSSQVKMASVMRDIWVQIPGYGGQKLNAACVYGGPELTIRTINENFGLNIRKYALVNMECLVEVVDAMGGLQLDVSGSESRAISRLNASSVGASDGSGKYVSAGVPSGEQVTLDGKQVLAYARIRKSDSDYKRTSRQRTVLIAIARKMQKMNLLSLAGLVTTMLKYVETNLSFDEIMDIASVCVKADLNSLSEFRIPADGTYRDGMFGNTWCIKPDFEANTKALHEFIYG
ncbi:MAG: LCP family protein [Clostridia bacterium]|nr:LCP family protein [Clostridia bacterium]